MRRERLEKMVNLLSHLLSKEALMLLTPEEVERFFYQLITIQTDTSKEWMEKYYGQKGNKRANKDISQKKGNERAS